MPLFVRRFAVDFVETAIAAILALNIAIPGTLDEARAFAAVVGVAILTALVAALRRASPGFSEWLRAALGVQDS